MNRYECRLILQGLLSEDKKRKIHITLKNRRWYNGELNSCEDEEFIRLKEDEIGLINIPYDWIINIEPKKERR